MVDGDFGDTVVGVPRPPLTEPGLADADTIIRNPAAVPRPRTASTTPVPPAGARRGRDSRALSHPRRQPAADRPGCAGVRRRRPVPPRIPLGAPPHLVRVPSPHSEVSGTHVEVMQQGSSIIVTDLKSTNATVVLVPGAVPLRLRQGESVVVTPGTVVDIGDGNRIEILPTQRLI